MNNKVIVRIPRSVYPLESLRAAAICLGTKADIRLIAKRQYWTIVIQSKARARIERIADELLNEALSHSRRQECLKSAHNLIGIPKDSLTVDIGSNVGLLLSGFRDQGMRVQGVDPTPRMTAIAIKNGIDTITEGWSPEVAKRVLSEKGKAAVITGTNVFAHIDDLDAVMQGVDTLLDAKGVFVTESPYLVDFLEKLEYDTIYHQHLSYFSIAPLQKFFARFGMALINVQKTNYHGGSVRVFVARNGAYPADPVVEKMIAEEKARKIHSFERMEQFAKDVFAQRVILNTMLVNLKQEGKTIVGVGAPAKGSTLLNFCGITSALVDFVTEKNPLKIGRFTPGTHIPIKTDDELLKTQPDYALILAWNFAPEIMKNLQAYKAKGGKFIIPIPSPTIV